jgi:hypothetical protein
MQHVTLNMTRAKYIEGLENRLGRMESLLRLSGLLSDDDSGATDLGTLEKRLADKTAAAAREKSLSDGSKSTPGVHEASSTNGTPRLGTVSTPASGEPSPEPPKSGRNEEEVEALSDMMCSLVTNNCGETRYIGILPILILTGTTIADRVQDPPQASPYSHPKVSNG